MSAAHIAVWPEVADRAALKWEGEAGDIPVLYLGEVSHHLTHLGPDLGPWLLALSDRLTEFAATVAADGTRRRTPVELTAAINAECDAEADRQMIAGLRVVE